MSRLKLPQRNMGLVDQLFRLVVGAFCLYLGPFSDLLTTDTLSSVLLSIVAALAIGSAIFAWCPFYYVAGFNTYKSDKNK